VERVAQVGADPGFAVSGAQLELGNRQKQAANSLFRSSQKAPATPASPLDLGSLDAIGRRTDLFLVISSGWLGLF